MTRERDRNSLWAMLGNLGWPVLLGLAASTAFYTALHQGLLGTEFFPRYCAAHPILYCEVGLFFVGVAALAAQSGRSPQPAGHDAHDRIRDATVHPGTGRADVPRCSRSWTTFQAAARRSYLGRRLREALEFVDRTGNADGLDEELKYLSELDEVRQHDSYGLVRIVIWATPMLGFLGTVVGITQALGDLDPKLLATAIETGHARTVGRPVRGVRYDVTRPVAVDGADVRAVLLQNVWRLSSCRSWTPVPAKSCRGGLNGGYVA